MKSPKETGGNRESPITKRVAINCWPVRWPGLMDSGLASRGWVPVLGAGGGLVMAALAGADQGVPLDRVNLLKEVRLDQVVVVEVHAAVEAVNPGVVEEPVAFEVAHVSFVAGRICRAEQRVNPIRLPDDQRAVVIHDGMPLNSHRSQSQNQVGQVLEPGEGGDQVIGVVHGGQFRGKWGAKSSTTGFFFPEPIQVSAS